MKYLQYSQLSGELRAVDGDNSSVIALGYAGKKGRCRNNPDCQAEKSKGPLPRGRYSIIEQAHARFAKPAFALLPHDGNEMHGRSAFWIHGDNATGDASTGCIVLDRGERSEVKNYIGEGYQTLHVVF